MDNNANDAHKSDVNMNKNCVARTTIRVGSRDSELAMKQTHMVIESMKSFHPDIDYKIESMKTLGDKVLDVSLSKIGSKALFTKELEVALEEKNVDIVVHSLKDLPTTLPDGLVIGAVCKRENPCDAVIMHPKHQKSSLSSLPSDSVIGTSSLRRVAQLKRRFPHLQFESIRGNLNTRLKKLQEDNKYDAIVLAAAGVIRMGWGREISEYLEYENCMYAVGQGALAIECRELDINTQELLAPLNHLETLLCITSERSFMKKLEGGCSVPLAVQCEIKEEVITLRGGVWSLDGSEEIVKSHSTSLKEIPEEEKMASSVKVSRQNPVTYCGVVAPRRYKDKINASYNLGSVLADQLLEAGARPLLDAAKLSNNMPANTHPSIQVKNGTLNGDANKVKVG